MISPLNGDLPPLTSVINQLLSGMILQVDNTFKENQPTIMYQKKTSYQLVSHSIPISFIDSTKHGLNLWG